MLSSLVPTLFRRRKRGGGSSAAARMALDDDSSENHPHEEEEEVVGSTNKKGAKGRKRILGKLRRERVVVVSEPSTPKMSNVDVFGGDGEGEGEDENQSAHANVHQRHAQLEERKKGVELVFPEMYDGGDVVDNVEVQLVPPSPRRKQPQQQQQRNGLLAEALSQDEDLYLNGADTRCTTGSLTPSDADDSNNNDNNPNEDDHHSYYSAQSNMEDDDDDNKSLESGSSLDSYIGSVATLQVRSCTFDDDSPQQQHEQEQASLLAESYHSHDEIPWSVPLSSQDDDEAEEEVEVEEPSETSSFTVQAEAAANGTYCTGGSTSRRKENCATECVLPWANCATGCENNTYDDHHPWFANCSETQQQQQYQQVMQPLAKMKVEMSLMEALVDSGDSNDQDEEEQEDQQQQQQSEDAFYLANDQQATDSSPPTGTNPQPPADAPLLMSEVDDSEDELFHSVRDIGTRSRSNGKERTSMLPVCMPLLMDDGLVLPEPESSDAEDELFHSLRDIGARSRSSGKYRKLTMGQSLVLPEPESDSDEEEDDELFHSVRDIGTRSRSIGKERNLSMAESLLLPEPEDELFHSVREIGARSRSCGRGRVVPTDPGLVLPDPNKEEDKLFGSRSRGKEPVANNLQVDQPAMMDGESDTEEDELSHTVRDMSARSRSRGKEPVTSYIDRPLMMEEDSDEEEDELFHSVSDRGARTRSQDKETMSGMIPSSLSPSNDNEEERIVDMDQLVIPESDNDEDDEMFHSVRGSRTTRSRHSRNDDSLSSFDNSHFSSCAEFDAEIHPNEAVNSIAPQPPLRTIYSNLSLAAEWEDEDVLPPAAISSMPSPPEGQVEDACPADEVSNYVEDSSLSSHGVSVVQTSTTIVEDPAASPSLDADAAPAETHSMVASQSQSVGSDGHSRHAEDVQPSETLDVVEEMQALIHEIRDTKGDQGSSILKSSSLDGSVDVDVDDFLDMDILVPEPTVDDYAPLSKSCSDESTEIDVDDLQVLSSLTDPDEVGLVQSSSHESIEVDVDALEEEIPLSKPGIDGTDADEFERQAFQSTEGELDVDELAESMSLTEGESKPPCCAAAVVTPDAVGRESLQKNDDAESGDERQPTVAVADVGGIKVDESCSEEASCGSCGSDRSHAEVKLVTLLEMIAKYEADNVDPVESSGSAPQPPHAGEDSLVNAGCREESRDVDDCNEIDDGCDTKHARQSSDGGECQVNALQTNGLLVTPLVVAEQPESLETSPQGITPKEKKDLLMRELQFTQKHGMFQFIQDEHGSASWREHEAQYQRKQREKRLSLPMLPAVSTKDCFSNLSADDLSIIPSDGMMTMRPRPRNLIRELKFIQTQGDDVLKSIDDKVKSWQRHESKRQLVETQDESGGPSASSSPSHSEDKDKPQNAFTPSENTETTCTQSCSDTGSGEGLLRRELTASTLSALSDEGAKPVTCDRPGQTPREQSLVAASDNETIEITVYSLMRSLASDEEEWTVRESVEENILEYFNLDKLQGDQDDDSDDSESEQVGEYGTVGYGVSDNASHVSELTTPSVATHVVVIESSAESPPSPDSIEACMEEANSHLRRLRKVTPLPKKAPPKRSLPFQQVKLKKSFTNPPRLPQMRQAALLKMYREQLKHVDTLEGGQPQDHDAAPWKRALRRCLSDKPTKCDQTDLDDAKDGDGGNRKSSVSKPRLPVPVKLSPSQCILDFDFDELAAMDEESSQEQEEQADRFPDLRLQISQETPSHVLTHSPPTPNQIGKSNCYYSSVSISFLAASLREQTIVEVLEEGLRILRPGGILNVLDMNGAVMKRIRCHEQFAFLVFQEATDDDQERHETNTLSILEKSGLETKFDVNDPRIVHWTAVKRRRSSMVATTPTSVEFRELQSFDAGSTPMLVSPGQCGVTVSRETTSPPSRSFVF